MENKHTSTPWAQDKAASEPLITALNGVTNIAMCFDVHEETGANAAFIVRACNSYYDMLDALEAIADGNDRKSRIARAAIAKAKGV